MISTVLKVMRENTIVRGEVAIDLIANRADDRVASAKRNHVLTDLDPCSIEESVRYEASSNNFRTSSIYLRGWYRKRESNVLFIWSSIYLLCFSHKVLIGVCFGAINAGHGCNR